MEKQYYNSYPALSLSLLLLLIMASSGAFVVSTAFMEEKIFLLAKRHVSITNDLGLGSVLKIHCQSKDNDLGIHNLTFHNTFRWKFKSNAFVANTEFYCSMWWGNKSGSFDVYKATRDDDKCKDCKWSIRIDGAYWFDPLTNSWKIMFAWPN